ncbi:MAG: hypothetical protein HY540_03540, partial [Deltaproteobacteria bacterium]|nr:hypothetical protein [Deltaproteobacteria bacterium]
GGGALGPQSVHVTKLMIDENGKKTEVELPDDKTLEVSKGTFISQGPRDVGPRFESTVRYQVRNISSRSQSIRLPAQVGPFALRSQESLTRELAPQKSFVLDVTFRPKVGEAKAGETRKSILIGTDLFHLVGVALEPQGEASLSQINENGTVGQNDIDRIDVGSIAVAANPQKSFFQCQKRSCPQGEAFTECTACPNPETMPCELLPITKEGKPIGEVDATCSPKQADAIPMMAIDLKGSMQTPLKNGKQILVLRNRGVKPLTLRSIEIQEVKQSKSRGQFSLPEHAVFVAKRFEDIKAKLNAEKAKGATFPITLPPFTPGIDETSAYLVVSYLPTDLLGFDGREAGVGSPTQDRAMLRVITDSEPIQTELRGSTTIIEAPALELYFKTSVGTKRIANGGSFPLSSITGKTKDAAFPLFMRLSDGAPTPMRITGIEIAGPDARSFEWLDSATEISAVRPSTGEGLRCSIPTLDANGNMTGENFNLQPISLKAPGFDLLPGTFTVENMPLFGCVNFHRGATEEQKYLYQATLTVTAVELTLEKTPKLNPDGSPKQTTYAIQLMAAMSPTKGKLVLRINQIMSIILNPEFAGLSSNPEFSVYESDIAEGKAKKSDLPMFLVSVIVDPFDEMRITDPAGKEIVDEPNNGITAVMRPLDTHAVSTTYENEFLYDYSSLTFDKTLPTGTQGIFEDYPNVPEGTQTNGLRIFTSSLSYPGPLRPVEERPEYPSNCITINPCSPEGWKKFSSDYVAPGEPGACTYFYGSAGRYDSSAFQPPEVPGGEYRHMCDSVDKPQKLLTLNTGRSTVDGHVTIEEMGLRLFGPTYFHNPYGPFERVRPLDTVFYTAFTTGVLKPQTTPEDPNVLPDPMIDQAKQMYKINLTDPTHVNAAICPRATNNTVIRGKQASSWKYIREFISLDEAGTIPAGCPDSGNGFKGGVAFLHGRPIDPETKVATFVSAMRGGPSESLTFALRNVPLFFILNGWFCDPTGREEDFEGKRCFDIVPNERDSEGQISILEGTEVRP